MQSYRTTGCEKFGHREFTIQLEEEPPVPDLHKILIDFFEEGVAAKTVFSPGETVNVGWSVLQLCDRDDGTIGVQERELTPDVQWTEQVDRALVDTWFQREVAASVNLIDELDFPSQDDAVMVAKCAENAMNVVLARHPKETPDDNISGWSLVCTEKHDHGERKFLPLIAIAALKPSLVQFLALPADTVVLALYGEKSGAPTGQLALQPYVLRGGEKVEPNPGSYLDALGS